MQGIRLEVRFHTSIEIVVKCSKTAAVRGEPFITLSHGRISIFLNWKYREKNQRGLVLLHVLYNIRRTSGSFALSFRGSGFSNFISYDSSEEELAETLEPLQPINDVKVSDKMEITDEAGKFGVA